MERDTDSLTALYIKTISTHTLTWSVTNVRYKFRWRCEFQLTRSRGAWRINAQSKHAISIFQLTRSRGAWRITAWARHELFNFNSHAHVERDVIWICTKITSIYFNSHAHVERDCKHWYWNIFIFISTHTLTWSVTGEIVRNWINAQFQLTRSRGAWHTRQLSYIYHILISTHTLTWSVTQNLLTHINNVFISTHTLTWSVTIDIII